MQVLKKMVNYVNPWAKKDPNAPDSINLKFMHGMNRISILMFLGCLVLLIVRYISRH